MFYKSCKPAALLQDYVSEYVMCHNKDAGDTLLVDKPIPRVGGAMLFHFGDAPAVVAESQMRWLPRVFFVNQAMHPVYFCAGRSVDMLLVRFAPAAIPRLFGLSPVDLGPGCVDAVQLVGRSVLLLAEQLAGEQRVEQRIKLMDAYLSALLMRRGPGLADEVVERMIAAVMHGHGCSRVSDIYRQSSLDERTLRRHFQAQVGCNVKSFSRLVKFNHVVATMLRDQHVCDFDLVAQFGYFDQSHFIADFQDFYGETPSVFRKRNKDNLLLLSALL